MSPSSSETLPPQWAQALLRALLESRCRDMIVGDLLEEYRERAACGVTPARSWYVWQVLSFARGRNLRVLPFRVFPRVVVWAIGVGLAQYAVLVALPHAAGIPVELGAFSFLAAVLAMIGATAICRSHVREAACRMVVRIASHWFLAFAVVAIGTLKLAAFTPVPGVILFMICVPGAAVHASARTSRIGLGIATAVTTGSLIALLTAAAASILNLPHPPLGTLPFLPALAAILGAVGALFGIEFGSPVRISIVDRTAYTGTRNALTVD